MSSSKQRKTRDIRGFFNRIQVTTGDTALDKQQNLEVRNELYRQQNEKDLLKVRKEKKKKAEHEEAVFEVLKWREEWDCRIAKTMAKLETKRVALRRKLEAEEQNRKVIPEGKIILLKNHAEPAATAAAEATPELGSELKPARINVNWADNQWAKAQAIAVVKKNAGAIAASLRQLQADEGYNATGIFSKLKNATLYSWYKKDQEMLLNDPATIKERPEHMKCPVEDSVLAKMNQRLVELGGAGATLNSTSITPVFKAIIEQYQPGLLYDEKNNPNGFKMCVSWVNNRCAKWGFSMQRKTTTSDHLPENYIDLLEMMNLRLAFYVNRFKIPEGLVANIDETPLKGNANGECETRAKKNSGDVKGAGKDSKFQVTITPIFLMNGEIHDKMQVIGDGVEYISKGPNKGKHAKGAMPENFSKPEYAENLTWNQTPSHFARSSSVKAMFEDILVPMFEKKIEEMGLIGQKKIDELKASEGYDKDNEEHNPEHQRVVVKWDVYKVHRMKEIRDWIKECYPWVLLNFVPARCTPKGQELDVRCNSVIQACAAAEVSRMQVARLMAQMKENEEQAAEDGAAPARRLVIDVSKSELKKNLAAVAKAALLGAREKLSQSALIRATEETGADQAWVLAFQMRALQMAADGTLFAGKRQEDEPYGQEMEPKELEVNEADIPAGAPEKPKQKKMSARDVFVRENRADRQAHLGCRTLKEAETDLMKQWKDMSKGNKEPWEQLKKARDIEQKEELKKWQADVLKLIQDAAGQELEDDDVDPDDDESDCEACKMERRHGCTIETRLHTCGQEDQDELPEDEEVAEAMDEGASAPENMEEG